MRKNVADYQLSDYNTVAERIAEFRLQFPDGSLQPINPEKPYEIVKLGDKTFLVYSAACYRNPDDDRPGIGVAWEPFPGRTPYTRDSELMNAETSAWGRAIVAALAADTKKGISTREDVRNRDQDFEPPIGGQVELREAASGFRDEAFKKGFTWQNARDLYAHIKKTNEHILAVPVTNELGDTEKLGDLLIRLGVEPQ
jgi:hypothetical protein